MTEKDYSLLRPFDLDAAKAGAKVCYGSDGDCESVTFLAEAGPDGDHAIRDHEGNCYVEPDYGLKMAPLCWVEGKPVYPGDVLWQTTPAGYVLKRKAKQISADGSYLEFEKTGSWAMDGSVSKLSWAEPPPKPVKRWINVYPNTGYDTKAAADQEEVFGRIACIEIELPPLPAK